MNGKRNTPIDISKGIGIFLVVLGHVLKTMLPNSSVLYALIYSFHMPLFFCISGYLAYVTYSNKESTAIILQKTKTILLPFIIWGITYSIYSGNNISIFLFDKWNLGYWFLISLYFIFILHLFAHRMHTIFTKYNKILEVILYFIAFCIIILIETKYIKINDSISRIMQIHYLSKYYPFFILGWLVNEYNKYIERIINKDIIYALSLIIFITCFLIQLLYKSSFITIFMCGVSGSILTLYIANTQITNQQIKSFFIVLGKYSLNIYVIHYFLINFNLNEIFNITTSYNSVIILSIALPITMFVICLCLFLNKILTYSSKVNKILFGGK